MTTSESNAAGISDEKQWDHSTHEAFFRYYADQSAQPATIAHANRVRDMLLRVWYSRHGVDRIEVADIGCGAGAKAQLWASLGHSVRGLDINARLIDLARQRAAQLGSAVDFNVGSATDLPWADSSIDICIASELLEHVADWQRCLDEFTRVLRPGGLLYLTTTNKLCPAQEEFNLPFYSWYPGSVKRYFERLAVTTRKDIANYATYPAVNWFSFYSLRDALKKRGCTSLDRFDVMDPQSKSAPARFVLKLITNYPPVRFVAHILTHGTTVVAIKDSQVS